MKKNDFDAALIQNFRLLTRNIYEYLRKAESDAFSELLDRENFSFLEGVTFSRNCPICGTRFESAAEKYFSRGMHIITCHYCNFTYSREIIKEHLDRERYALSNSSTAHIILKQNLIYQDLDKKKSEYIIDKLSEYVPQTYPIKMLDIGCALGGLLSVAHQSDWEAEGIEANPEMVKLCHERNLNVINGFYPEVIQSCKNKYNAIVLLDVLEHVEKPIEFSLSLKQFLMDNAVVAVQVPNFQSLAIRLEGKNNNNFCHGHWSYFTPKTLNMVLEKAGFENLFLETYISEFDKIQQFPQDEICRVAQEITGKSVIESDITIDWLHGNLLGYKVFGIYRLKK